MFGPPPARVPQYVGVPNPPPECSDRYGIPLLATCRILRAGLQRRFEHPPTDDARQELRMIVSREFLEVGTLPRYQNIRPDIMEGLPKTGRTSNVTLHSFFG